MKKRLCRLTALFTLAALMFTSSLTFASQAVVDDWTDYYEHQSRFDDSIVVDGIDVSYWQGGNIDWDAVKRHGIDYVFIRLGSSDFDDATAVFKDRYFETNYEGAKAAGLMVGIYYRSDATTVAQAKQEAQFVLDTLASRDLDLPVVYDYEKGGNITGTASMTSNALAFLNYIATNSDYTPMFYSYRSMMDPNYGGTSNMSLIDSKYPVWIAQYATDINSYSRPFEFWQYADDGTVSGISGYVDCNFWYLDTDNYPAASDKIDIADAAVTLSTSSYTYDGEPKTPSVTVTYGGKRLTKGTDYEISYIKNALAGDAYVLVRGKNNFDGMKKVTYGVKIPFSQCTVSAISAQRYTGSAVKPTVKVYYQGELLTKGEDYIVTYKNNTAMGTATATIKGKDRFSGTLTKNFTIKIGKPLNVKTNLRAAKTTGYNDIKVTWSKVPGASGYYVYYKKASASKYSYKKVTGGSTTTKILYDLAAGTKYNVKVKAYYSGGKSDYSSISSTTTLKKVTQNSVKKYSSSKVKVSWVNIADETGYQISRSTKKSATNVVATVKSTTAKSKVISVPKKGKAYYYKVRAYKLVGGVKVFGPWSSVKSYKLN